MKNIFLMILGVTFLISARQDPMSTVNQFTVDYSDGIKHILNKAGFLINEITPEVGTLGTGLHLRQLVFNSWFRRIPLGWLFSNLINIVYNFRIIISDIISPIGTRLSSPVIFCIKAKPILNGK